MKRVFLSKKAGWILVAILVYIDALLDVIRGREGNPLWIPFVERFGIYVVLFLAPFIVLLFYFAIKILAKIAAATDKTPFTEEILLTSLVIIYALFDLWLVSADFFSFSLIRGFRHTIPYLTAAGLIYALWAEWKVKRNC